MIVNNQNAAGSLVLEFTSNGFGEWHGKTIRYFKHGGNVAHEFYEHWSHKNNDDSTA